jgi:hypothetical protein
MIKEIKLNTALLVCVVFIFRIVFVNINTLSATNTHHSKGSAKSQVSTKIKRRRGVDITVPSKSFEYLTTEMTCEENANTNAKPKSNPAVLFTQVLAPSGVNNTQNKPVSVTHYRHPVYTQSHLYLTLEVFRI